MRDAEYMIQNIMLTRELPVLTTDGQYQCLSYNDGVFQAEGFFKENQDLWEILVSRSRKNQLPVLYLEKGNWGYAVIQDTQEDRNYFLGPVMLGELPRREIWEYRNICRYFEDRSFLKKQVGYDRLLGYIHALYFAVHHCQLDGERFLEENDIPLNKWKVNEHERLMYQISSSDRKRNYNAYQIEQRWIDAVKRGEEGEALVESLGMDMVNNVGEMAKSSFKQLEYSCVCMITLLTRAAIEAGVPTMESYNISDMYLQKLEQCKNQPEIQTVMGNAYHEFVESIRRTKSSPGVPNYIMTCKDYIAQHRTQNIHISELAEVIGVSHSYLTKKFKETEGITIQQYIIKERIKAAANMIKYSDASLSQIAEYLNFSSQSHMGQYFRKEFGMTPQEYRRKFKIVDFT